MRVSQSRRQVLWAVGFAGLGVCGARRSTREVRKLGHAREWWSCGRFVFVDEAAEDFAFVDGDRGCADEQGRGLVWRLKRERAVRPVSVVMGGVDAEHLLEVAAVDDQDPVEALAAEGADPTLGVRIRIRSSDGRPDDPHALAAEDLVEGAAELTVASVKQKAEGPFLVGQVHQEVARLLCDPAPIRIARARHELDPTTLERDEEEDVDPREPDRLDRQEVAGEHRRRLLAQEQPPTQPVSFWRGWQPMPDQDQTDRTRGDTDSEAVQLAHNPPVAP